MAQEMEDEKLEKPCGVKKEGDDRARRGAKRKAVLNVGGRGKGLTPKSLLRRDQQGDSNSLTFLF